MSNKKSSLQIHFFWYNTIMKKLKIHNFGILKKTRIDLGFSQRAMAAQFGVTQQHWDRYEKGYPIPLEKILKISQVLKISRWELLPPEFRPEQSSFFNQEKLILIIASVEKLIIEKKTELSKNNSEKTSFTTNADEIKKFKDLLDSGIITQEEFDEKKKQLLGL